MASHLVQGTQLQAVCGTSGQNGNLWLRLGTESHHCKEIVVVEEPGPMSMLPWAKATTNGGAVYLVNLQNIESVELLKEEG